MVVVGIDPGTGVSSGTGLSAFRTDTKDLLLTEELGALNRKAEHRLRDIGTLVEGAILSLEYDFPTEVFLVCVEEFVMRGKGGLVLQRLVGSVISRVPYKHPVRHVQNTRVKSLLAGHGHADKKAVAMGVRAWFEGNKESVREVDRLIRSQAWDILDSLAIGIAGYEMEVA